MSFLSGKSPPGREFAIRYVLHFDNFTPSTIEASHDLLKRMIAPRSWAGASESLEKRRQVALEGRMSSQVIPLSARVRGLTVTVEATRRTFISDKLSREAKIEYDAANLTASLAIVVGNEGKGISRLVREHCDLLIALPMRGSVNSLNAAVAWRF